MKISATAITTTIAPAAIIGVVVFAIGCGDWLGIEVVSMTPEEASLVPEEVF